jgi:hypothetical protein
MLVRGKLAKTPDGIDLPAIKFKSKDGSNNSLPLRWKNEFTFYRLLLRAHDADRCRV